MTDKELAEWPDWCPKDVWQQTALEWDKLYDAEPMLEGGCEVGVRETIARNMIAARRHGVEEAADFAGGSTMPRHEIADYLKAKGYDVPADMVHHALRLYMMPAIRARAETGGGDE